MDQPRRKASWPFWVLGVLLVLAAIGGFLAVLIPGIIQLGNDLIRVDVPGETTLSLNETGTYTIFRETSGSSGGRAYHHDDNSFDIQCTLTRQSDGRKVELRSPKMEQNYSYNDSSGVSVLEFTIDQPGAYTLVTDAAEDSVLIIGRDFVGRLFRLIGLSVLVGAGLGVLAVVMFILGIVRVVKNSRIDRIPVATAAPPVQ